MNIYVIDDSGELSSLLTTEEVGMSFFEDEVQALRAVRDCQPSMVLLNYRQWRRNTPDYIRLLLEASPDSHIIVVGDDVPEDMICQCLLAGADGYQNQTQLNVYFAKMVRVIAQGETWVSRKLVARLLDGIRSMANSGVHFDQEPQKCTEASK